jgi:hypothetical protein
MMIILTWVRDQICTNFLDCRINACRSTRYTRHLKQKLNFLFIDFDSQILDLDKELEGILANIKSKFQNNTIEPTVLWSGKGYHIYLPVDAILLENESLFEDIEVYDLSRKFIQWAEQYLSNNRNRFLPLPQSFLLCSQNLLEDLDNL